MLTELQLESSEQIKLLTDNLTEATTKLSAQNEKLDKMSIEHSNVVSELRSQLEQKHLALDLKIQEHNQGMIFFTFDYPKLFFCLNDILFSP